MKEGREGPLVTISRSCSGCRYEETEGYRVQSDTGRDVYCTNSLVQIGDRRRHIGDTTWSTPDWCPFLRFSTPTDYDGPTLEWLLEWALKEEEAGGFPGVQQDKFDRFLRKEGEKK